MYGHDYGDIVLETAAMRIQGSLRTSDTVASLGGDEFAVILRNVKDRSDSGIVAKEIIKNLESLIAIKGHTFYLTHCDQ